MFQRSVPLEYFRGCTAKAGSRYRISNCFYVTHTVWVIYFMFFYSIIYTVKLWVILYHIMTHIRYESKIMSYFRLHNWTPSWQSEMESVFKSLARFQIIKNPFDDLCRLSYLDHKNEMVSHHKVKLQMTVIELIFSIQWFFCITKVQKKHFDC